MSRMRYTIGFFFEKTILFKFKILLKVILFFVSKFILFLIIHLFTCANIVWFISLPCSPPPLHSPHFQAEPILPLSLILLKKRQA
jgi:hypothetical protein